MRKLILIGHSTSRCMVSTWYFGPDSCVHQTKEMLVATRLLYPWNIHACPDHLIINPMVDRAAQRSCWLDDLNHIISPIEFKPLNSFSLTINLMNRQNSDFFFSNFVAGYWTSIISSSLCEWLQYRMGTIVGDIIDTRSSVYNLPWGKNIWLETRKWDLSFDFHKHYLILACIIWKDNSRSFSGWELYWTCYHHCFISSISSRDCVCPGNVEFFTWINLWIHYQLFMFQEKERSFMS